MAYNAASTLKVSSGHFYYKEQPIDKFEDLGDLSPKVMEEKGWKVLGYTTPDNILVPSTEGGETTILSALQNAALRTSTSPAIRSSTVQFLQWDEDVIKLYLGETVQIENGDVYVSDTLVPREVALCIVLEDGQRKISIQVPKCAAIADGDLFNIENKEDLIHLSVKFTFMKHDKLERTFKVGGILPAEKATPAPPARG